MQANGSSATDHYKNCSSYRHNKILYGKDLKKAKTKGIRVKVD